MSEAPDNGCLHCALAVVIQKTVSEFYDLGADETFDVGALIDALAEVLGDLISQVQAKNREQLIMMVEATIREKITIAHEDDAQTGGTH